MSRAAELPTPIARDTWQQALRDNPRTPAQSTALGAKPGAAQTGGAVDSIATIPARDPWRDEARRSADRSIANGLYPSPEVAPRVPGTGAGARVVGSDVAVGGVVYDGAYYKPACSSSSSFSFSLFLGGGWGGAFGFSYSSGWCGSGWSVGIGSGWGGWCGWSAPAYAWAPCGGWAPAWGWWPGRWCAWSAPCVSPWWRPVTWWDPWCAPVAWPVWTQPSWALCFGLPAYTTTYVYAVETFQPPPPPVVELQSPAVVLSPDQAWGLLAAGYDQQAMSDFFALSGAQPGNPGHQVGYALAQAFLALDESAVIALRGAMRERAEALLLVPTDETLRRRLWLLADRLRDRARTLDGTPAQRDTLFLLASVQAILYDNANAYFSVSRAIELGDRDQSAINLKSMLQARLEQSF